MNGGVTLAIDTATTVLAGVARAGTVAARTRVDDARQHVEQLAPLVQRALGAADVSFADIDAVVAGLGPGPFTGLRVGVVTAQVIADTVGAPLHGVCSLDIIALVWATRGAPPGTDFVVASDARRKELYWARYDHSGRRLGSAQVSTPGDLPDLPLIGPGADLYPALLGDRAVDGPRAIDPGLLAVHGLELPSAGTQPLYLRRPDAGVPTTRKSTLVAPRLPRAGRRAR